MISTPASLEEPRKEAAALAAAAAAAAAAVVVPLVVQKAVGDVGDGVHGLLMWDRKVFSSSFHNG